MKIIKPADVIPCLGEILSNSIDKIIVASIDVDLNKYPPLWEMLKRQKEAGVKLFLYTANSYSGGRLSKYLQIKELLVIRNLNFNLIMNDQQAIISSQHFGAPANGNLEISLITESEEEYQQVFSYYVEFLHENASRPSSYYLLNEETLSENVLQKDLVPQNHPEVEMVKKYHPLSTYMASLGYLQNNKKVGSWLYFKPNGFLDMLQKYDGDDLISETINWDKTPDKQYLFYSFINIVGGLYRVSIGGTNLNTTFDELIGNQNRSLLFNYIQESFKIKFPPAAIHTFDDLIQVTMAQLIKRKPKVAWNKILSKS